MSNKAGFAAGAENALAAIFSVEGPSLSPDESRFFRESNPLGFILFARNCQNPKQLSELTKALKESVGRECPVLIDQEGGRVQRLKPPQWRQYPPAKTFGDTAADDMDAALDALRFSTLQLGEELQSAGFNVNCAPVLDVLTAETHDAIGDRAFSSDPAIVARLGLSVCRNLLAAGITPVMKHMPGHGRSGLDTHHDLPVVKASLEELESDFAPFRSLAASDVAPALWGMTAHIIFTAVDAGNPVTVSEAGIHGIIRESLGFDGFLLSDDLDMKALDKYGDIAKKTKLVLGAGCDAGLYCAGRLKDMKKIAESVPKLAGKSLQRLQKAAEYIRLAA
ncbi:MAG: beta-N-acetylhexosaminidase [Alphaproteobacteria bacterium]